MKRKWQLNVSSSQKVTPSRGTLLATEWESERLREAFAQPSLAKQHLSVELKHRRQVLVLPRNYRLLPPTTP